MIALLLGVGLACENRPTSEAGPVVTVAETFSEVPGTREALVQAGVSELRWGYTPFLGSDDETEGWDPVFKWVGAALGVEIITVPIRNYAEAERMIVLGEVDVATMSPYGYVQAQKLEPELQVFASHVARGTPTYGVYIIAGGESPVQSLDDLRGSRFAYVDKRSTSGWLFPAARMLQQGIDPLKDLQAEFLGSHGAVFDAVASNQVDAGAIYDHALTEQRVLHPRGHDVRVIAKAPRVPFDAYVLRAGLPAVVGRGLGELLGELSTQTAEGRRLLGGTPSVNGFFPVKDDHYDILREVEQAVERGLSSG